MKNLIKIVWLFLIMGLVSNIFPQPITWEKIYNKPNTMWDGIEGICNADSGNYFLAGFTLLPSIGYKTWVIKINANGDTIWTRTVGVTGYSANSVVSSGDGGCVLTGGSGEAFSIKIDGNGNIIWERYYGGSGVQCRKIKKTSDGGYIACGRINLQDGYLIKIDSLGYFQWDQTYPSNEFKYLYDLTQNNDEYFLIGMGFESMQDTVKAIFMKVDSNGEVLLDKKINIKNRGATGMTIIKNNNNLLIAGSTGDSSRTLNIPFFSVIDSNGNSLFIKIFEETKSEYIKDMKIISNNKYLITTSRDSSPILSGKAIITDSLGNTIYQKIFLTSSFIGFTSTLPILNGDILFVAVADFKIPGADEVGYAVRTDSTLFYKTVNIYGNDELIDENFNLHQNYPNPFNPTTIITYEFKKRVKYELKLIDIAGKEIKVLMSEERNAGIYKYNLNVIGLNLSSGIYFIELNTSLGYKKNIKILFLK